MFLLEDTLAKLHLGNWSRSSPIQFAAKMPQFSSVHFCCSVVSDSLQPHESQHARPPCPSPTPGVYSNSCPSSWWCHPAISSCRPLLLLPPIPPSIRVFSNESTLCMRWPKCWSFSFSISPSNEHPELISFRMDWLDLLAVQGTLKSLLQHHSSKASSFQPSAIFTVQRSHPYMTTGKTIALTRWTFVGKLMSRNPSKALWRGVRSVCFPKIRIFSGSVLQFSFLTGCQGRNEGPTHRGNMPQHNKGHTWQTYS